MVALAKMKLTPVQLYADRTKLLDILSYHTVGGPAVAAADLKDGQQLTTINQHQLTVHVDRWGCERGRGKGLEGRGRRAYWGCEHPGDCVQDFGVGSGDLAVGGADKEHSGKWRSRTPTTRIHRPSPCDGPCSGLRTAIQRSCTRPGTW